MRRGSTAAWFLASFALIGVMLSFAPRATAQIGLSLETADTAPTPCPPKPKPAPAPSPSPAPPSPKPPH
jgi:hypothetical protein